MLPKFKYDVGQIFNTFGRELQIIDKKYIVKIKYRNKKPYKSNEKYYLYKCLKCGNEDWLLESLFSDTIHTRCNACYSIHHKLVVGINDITTTDPWMIKYFIGGSDEAKKYFKYSKNKINMICPDCGRIHLSSPHNVYSNKKLSCPCQDGWSYPNKLMYALLEQIGVKFESEKHFDWSNGKIYDNYIEYENLKIITEQHGIQHYKRVINAKARSLDEEQRNDKLKIELALSNGITNYIVINASYSDIDFMKNSILSSNLFSLLNIDYTCINWTRCHEFATSNLTKIICEYKMAHPDITLNEISKIFHISYNRVLQYIQIGTDIGWCSYKRFDDLKLRYQRNDLVVNNKPIHCITNNCYYRNAKTFVRYYEKEFGKKLCERNIRSVCQGKRNHVNNMRFEYITQQEFNQIKSIDNQHVFGDCFTLAKGE